MDLTHETAPEKPEVVIVGAGPAGMFLAYLLVTNGLSVRVLERHVDFKREFRGEGIQPSVMAVLEQLGFLPVLLKKGFAVPAEQARIYLDEEPVVTLGGLDGESEDFGLILFQEGFLAFLDEQLRRYPGYRLDLGLTVTDPVMENGRVVAMRGRRKGGGDESIEGKFFVATTGRNTALRKKVGIGVDVLEATYNIFWMKFDASSFPQLVPNGFQAYLRDDSMFIFYRSYDGRIQVAWGKRDWNIREFTDLEGLKRRLISEAPRDFRPLVEQEFGSQTERQILKVACGLDSRFDRVAERNSQVEWYDLDLPDVIELRRKRIGDEGGRYHLLGCSVLEPAWLEAVRVHRRRPLLFLAEGVFMYFTEAQVKSLVLTLRDHFPGAELVFDAWRPFEIWLGNFVLGGLLRWGLWRGQELEGWGDGIRLLDEWGYFDRPEPRLHSFRWMAPIFRLLKPFRVFHFQLGKAAG